jgi:hypothetical protein
VKCRFSTICACARQDFEASGRVERRFWLALGGCALLVIAYWLIAGLGRLLQQS